MQSIIMSWLFKKPVDIQQIFEIGIGWESEQFECGKGWEGVAEEKAHCNIYILYSWYTDGKR